MKRTLIKTNFFYDKNLIAPAKIIEYRTDAAELTTLEENMNAFKANDRYKI